MIPGVRHRMFVFALPLVALIAASAIAQQDDPPPPPSEQEQADDENKENAPPPTLDELLGIEDEESESKPVEDSELERRLNEQNAPDRFAKVLTDMQRSAQLMAGDNIASRENLRLQRAILDQLETMMELARRQAQAGQTPSSGDQEPRRNQQGQPRDPSTPSDATGNRQPNDQTVEDRTEQRDLEREIDELRAEWGHLPRRLRDMLLQGRRERFSAFYEAMTRAYYRKLAEGEDE
jgi:hypothetical protein